MRGMLFPLVALLLLVAVFAAQNPGLVAVRFLGWSGQTSLLVVIAAAFAAGAACAALCGLPGRLKRRARIRELEREAARAREGSTGGPPSGGPG